MDASSFWLHMGVALAHQLGLHKQPRPGSPDAALRRKLWWTLVVSLSVKYRRQAHLPNLGLDQRLSNSYKPRKTENDQPKGL